ncbi:EAL domain-containing protein [Neptuniibacter sp.]|uniref:EAL domain-containing protein n=1 Tax=Neptuniibacter sp. TaxID=1962643 RepID=UPI0026249ED2|nr:EAL domain-containing protein [Neptuniibacter sp.]MCP4595800.1 EAL domain-containing protein [Neptuniibacter sp.]
MTQADIHAEIEDSITIQHEQVVQGRTRWVGKRENSDTELLVAEYQGRYFAIPLLCSHGQASLLEARLDKNGNIICPNHGLVTALSSGPNSIEVQKQNSRFIPVTNKNIKVALIEPSQKDETKEEQEIKVLRSANSALQKKVLSNLESMDQMLTQVENKKTELEHRNSDLQTANELIDCITNSIDEFLIVTDSQGRITRVNSYAENILECNASSLLGTSPDNILCDSVLEELVNATPSQQWDQRPHIYRAVYKNSEFEREVCFKSQNTNGQSITDKHFLLRGTLLYSHAGKEEGLILTATDISRVKQSEHIKRQQDLESHLSQLKNTLATLGQGVAMFGPDGHLQVWNPPFSSNGGFREELLQQLPHITQLCRITHELTGDNPSPEPEQLSKAKQKWLLFYECGNVIECESYPMPSGGFVITTRDITQSREAEEHVRLLSSTVEQSSHEVIITDTDGIVVYVNPIFTENTGYSAGEAIGKKSNLVQSGEMSDRFYKDLWQTIKNGNRWKGEIINRKKSGEKFWQYMTVSPITDSSGAITHFLSLKSDITKQKQAESQLRYQAEHDLLTDLPNRPLFLNHLESAILSAKHNQKHSAMLFMDLDNFKDVNDTLGHLCGDTLLQLVAQRLLNCVEKADVVARLGGDEFAIIQADISSLKTPGELADRIIDSITQPYQIDDHLIHIGISIGITLIPTDGLETGTLLSNADMAMYAAKAGSGPGYYYYDQELQSKIQRKHLIEIHLHKAIRDNELCLVYQPKILIEDSQIVGAEVLLRWNSQHLGFISPAEFIPIAEQSSLILELGEWVLKETLSTLRSKLQQGITPPKIAINLSTVQLKDGNFVEELSDLLQEYDIPAEYIELEITETAAMSDPEFAMAQLKALKNLGISIAMDDFGTGYSSLSYLASLPVERVKIDRSFINDIEHSKQARAIVESIINLGSIMEKTIIAEGVEEQAQLELLKALGCEEAQGYLISKPLSTDEFFTFVSQRSIKRT